MDFGAAAVVVKRATKYIATNEFGPAAAFFAVPGPIYTADDPNNAAGVFEFVDNGRNPIKIV